MFGSNFGLFGSAAGAARRLRVFASITSPAAKILAGSLNPYRTEDPVHLAYHRRNKARGRMAGRYACESVTGNGQHHGLSTSWYRRGKWMSWRDAEGGAWTDSPKTPTRTTLASWSSSRDSRVDDETSSSNRDWLACGRKNDARVQARIRAGAARPLQRSREGVPFRQYWSRITRCISAARADVAGDSASPSMRFWRSAEIKLGPFGSDWRSHSQRPRCQTRCQTLLGLRPLACA